MVCILFRLRNSPDTGDNVEPILAGDQSNPSAADNSLAGDREHGLPNNTKTEEQPVVNILEILENIHTENTGQVGPFDIALLLLWFQFMI